MKTSYLIIPALEKSIPTDPLKYEPSSFEEEVFKNEMYSGEEDKETNDLPDHTADYTIGFNSEYGED